MDPVIGNRVRRRFLDGWMRSKTKIVLRCEVHSPKTAAGVILRGTNSLWRLIRRLGIGPVSISPAEILPRVEIFDTFEKILAVRVAVLAQTPSQRVQRHNLIRALAHEFPPHRHRGHCYCSLTVEDPSAETLPAKSEEISNEWATCGKTIRSIQVMMILYLFS